MNHILELELKNEWLTAGFWFKNQVARWVQP
jgi:hypothetical protein